MKGPVEQYFLVGYQKNIKPHTLKLASNMRPEARTKEREHYLRESKLLHAV